MIKRDLIGFESWLDASWRAVIQVPEGSERCSHELHATLAGAPNGREQDKARQGKDNVAAQSTPDGKTHGIRQAAAGYSQGPGHSQSMAVQVGEGRRPLGSSAEEDGAASPSPLGCGAARNAYGTGESIQAAARQPSREKERDPGTRGGFINGAGTRVPILSADPTLQYLPKYNHSSFVELKAVGSDRASRVQAREPAEIRRWVTRVWPPLCQCPWANRRSA